MSSASRFLSGPQPHLREHVTPTNSSLRALTGLLPGGSPRPMLAHAHTRRQPSWCGVDRFTLLCVGFVGLLLYTFVMPHTPLASAIAEWNENVRPAHVLHEDAPNTPTPHTHHQAATVGVPAEKPQPAYTPSVVDTANAAAAARALAADSFTLELIPLIPRSEDFPQDSTAETLMLKPKRDKTLGQSYHICTFTNVCVAPDGIRFRFQNYTAWQEFEGLAKRCDAQDYYRKNRVCHCFHYAFRPQVLPYEFYNQITEPVRKVKARESALNAAAIAAAKSSGTAPPKAQDSFSRRYSDPFAYTAQSQHGHYWSVHKWVAHHHIAHWAQKLMMFQGIFQHHPLFASRLPALDGIVFHDTSNTRPPLEDHLLSVFNLTIEAALAHPDPNTAPGSVGQGWAHPNLWNGPDPRKQIDRLLDPRSGRILWAEDVVQQRYTTTLPPDSCADVDKCRVPNSAYAAALKTAKTTKRADGTIEVAVPVGSDGRPIPERVTNPALQTCFARVSMTPTYGLLTMDAHDAQRFRAVTAARMELPDALQDPCPPRRAILLTRHDRRILNADKLSQHLLERYNLKLEYHAITGRNSSAEQVRLFATAGLVLSSHSSQLINVLFSHPSQALVEITPEFYNVDFASYAHALGLSFHYALGGSIAKSAAEHPEHSSDYVYQLDPFMIACVESLRSTCPSGDSWCIAKHAPSLCNKVTRWPNKQMNFFADMGAVQVAVQSAIAHIQDKCFGKW